MIVRPGFVRTLVLFAVFLLFVLVLLLALEALQLLEQPIHLVFKIAEPALDAGGSGARAATGASHAGPENVRAGTAAGSLLTGLAGGIVVLYIARIIDGISGASISVAQAAVSDVASSAA